jgi:NAD(P)-dependent dehydrogenase (short-subunit alcohol dehydrogenase family)
MSTNENEPHLIPVKEEVMKTALITGASQGLGKALLVALSKRGVRVVGVARGKGKLDEVTSDGIVADIGKPGASTRIALEAAAKVGDIDLVIHCASTLGPVPLRPLVDIGEDDLARVFLTNTVGPLALTKQIVGGMVVRGHGDVVFVSSDAAVEAYPTWGPYGAAKAAVDHAARVLAAELEGSGVRVLSVDPGEMDTAMHRDAIPDADPATLARPEEVARKILAIVDDAKTYPSGTRAKATEVKS